MSDVAVVALITGGTSVLTSGVTGLVTWQVSKNSSSVELTKVEAENDRLRMGHREEERRNRQSTYHQFIDVTVLIFQMLGKEVSLEERQDALANYNHLASGVSLFGSTAVSDAADEVTRVYNQIWFGLEFQQGEYPRKADPERWRDATTPLVEPLGSAISTMTRLMHADVTRGIADDQGTADE